jgi:DNA-directed RNA polymerase subunit RPC12/RpoP
MKIFFVGLFYIAAFYLLIVFTLFLAKFLYIVVRKPGGKCPECGSRFVWIWKSRDPELPFYVFERRKCLRCGCKDFGGWTPPVSEKETV